MQQCYFLTSKKKKPTIQVNVNCINPFRHCVHYNGHHMSAPLFNFWSISPSLKPAVHEMQKWMLYTLTELRYWGARRIYAIINISISQLWKGLEPPFLHSGLRLMALYQNPEFQEDWRNLISCPEKNDRGTPFSLFRSKFWVSLISKFVCFVQAKRSRWPIDVGGAINGWLSGRAAGGPCRRAGCTGARRRRYRTLSGFRALDAVRGDIRPGFAGSSV